MRRSHLNITNLYSHCQTSQSRGLTSSKPSHVNDLGGLAAQYDVPGVKVAEIETFLVEELHSLQDLQAT